MLAVYLDVNFFDCGFSAPRGAAEFRVQKEGFRVQIIFPMKPAWNLEAMFHDRKGFGLYAVRPGVDLFNTVLALPAVAGEFRVQNEGFRVHMIFQ